MARTRIPVRQTESPPEPEGNPPQPEPRGPEVPAPRPPSRRLRVFAFDPSLNTYLDTAVINEVTLHVPWESEEASSKSTLEPGPVGEYLEVIDVDPASGCAYMPVNLDDPALLAQDGLPPSEGNPQFHQQMVYAVAMTTIRNFEFALGRAAFWSPHYDPKEPREADEDKQAEKEFVRRLRIYPHALREANAYYSPVKKALLFGYFPASRTDPGANLPGGTVFACLSHDVIAHETTHALLDGMHRRFIEPSNVDALAFHEAFADIVALFQHFTFPRVLAHQIAKTRGDLASQNLLGKLAQQFGQAIGGHGALRDALGEIDPQTKAWRPKTPDPSELGRTFEPHARGAILVAAVFDAFLTIYKSRIADLLRIATSGTGVLPEGNLHPDLVARLAREASVSARHVLNMCIRALDYCPPVDVDFGDYFRALITGDEDLVPDDERGYRIAVIEAFRRRGIYPALVRSLSVESLRWHVPTDVEQSGYQKVLHSITELRSLFDEWGLSTDRQHAYVQSRRACHQVHDILAKVMKEDQAIGDRLGLDLRRDAKNWTIDRSAEGPNRDWPKLEVHSVRPASRVGPNGERINDMVIEITQKRRGFLNPEDQEAEDAGTAPPGADGRPRRPDFVFRGGTTLLIDLVNGRVRYSIGKSITSPRRLEEQRRYFGTRLDTSLRATYLRNALRVKSDEPLALLHTASPLEEERL